MTRARLATTVLVAVVAMVTLSALPAPRVSLDTSWRDGSIAGALHVHTNISDGRSSPEIVAAAAARAGLAFIVLTDHGDGTRMPDPPRYLSGVLVIDAVEISTTGGHYIALGLPDAPYPLGGDPDHVVEDVKRLGGIGIVAHPDSPKDALHWQYWDTPFDGLELINPDTSWRMRVFDGPRRSRWLVFQSLLAYPFRAPEAIARLLTPTRELTQQWDSLTQTRRVIGLAGVDAHAKLELRNTEPGDNRYSLPVPGYESSFRLMSVHVSPATPLTADAASDARLLIDAMANGRVYTSIDAWAGPAAFEFTASNASGRAQAGEMLAPNGPVTLHIRSNAPPQFETRVYRGRAVIVRRSGEQEITLEQDNEPAVYRVEIGRADAEDGPAWITSNPIYVRRPEAPSPVVPLAAARSSTPLFDGQTTNGWAIEHDQTSLAAIEAVAVEGGKAVRLRYGLSGGSKHNQFAAATVAPPADIATYSRLAFSARADQAMRISAQVRVEVPGAAPERFEQSIYVETTDRPLVVRFDGMRPVGRTSSPRPDPAAIRSILFIVETTNTRPGASGRVWLRDVRLERTAP